MAQTTDQCPGRSRNQRCAPYLLGTNFKGTIWRCELHNVAFVTGPTGKLLPPADKAEAAR